MKYEYIFFDFDGTIVDSSPGIISSFQYAQEKMNLSLWETREAYHRCIGPPLSYSFMEYCGLSAAQAEQAVAYYREHYQKKGIYECTVYEGMRELLQDLRKSGSITAIASAKPEYLIRELVGHFGMEDCFDHITGSPQDGSIGEKDVLILQAYQALQRADVPLCETRALMVGDRCYDAVGARKLGIDFLGALYGFGSSQEFEQEGFRNHAASAYDIRKFVF